MNYIEWLDSIGYRKQSLKFSELEAQHFAEALKNPGTEKMKFVNRIVIHHSATKTGNAACFRVLHRALNKWNDIGYHFVIGNGSFSKNGEIEEGRALPFIGAHAKGANEDSIGICLVGNFNKEMPTEKQFESLIALTKNLQEMYSIGNDDITLHRLIRGSKTECPGKNFLLSNFLFLLNTKSLK